MCSDPPTSDGTMTSLVCAVGIRMTLMNGVREINGIKTKSKSNKRFQATTFTSKFCIGYNFNLTTAVAAILIFVEGPESIASGKRPCQNVKSIL